MWAVFTYPLYFLLAYVVAMFAFLTASRTISGAPPILGFIARSMFAYLALIICAVYGTVSSAVLKVLGLEHAYGQWTTAKSFKYIGGAMTGVYFDIIDDGDKLLNSNRPVVIIGNHQTELDILMLGCIWPQHTSVTAKRSLRYTPFLGWFMILSGTVFIDRVDRAAAMKAFDGAAKTMKEKRQNVFIFPEGTRSYSATPQLLPFKKGAFHLAVQGQVDILPVVCENYSKILNVKARRFEPGTVRIKVLQPISTKGLTSADVDRLTTDTRDKMLKTLQDLSQDHRSTSVANDSAKKVS